MSFTRDEMQWAFANYRALFSGRNSAQRKCKKIKELLVAHHSSIGRQMSDPNLDRLVLLIQSLMQKRIFKNNGLGLSMFPDLFQPTVPRIAEREASEASAGRIESEMLEHVDSAHETDDNRDAEPGEARLEAALDSTDEAFFEARSVMDKEAEVFSASQEGKQLKLFPMYLPFETQHLVLGQVQRILEQSCFDFVLTWLPGEIQNRGWETANAVELTKWTRLIPKWQPKIPHEALELDSAETLRQTCTRVTQIRHAAVHRLPLTANTLQSLLQTAVRLTTALRDEEKTAALTKISEKLAKGTQELEREKTLIENSFDREMEAIRCQRQKLDEAELELLRSASQRDSNTKAEVGMEICTSTREILADLKPDGGIATAGAHCVSSEADTSPYWLVLFETIRARIW